MAECVDELRPYNANIKYSGFSQALENTSILSESEVKVEGLYNLRQQGDHV